MRLAVLVLALFCATGCGYRADSLLPEGVQRLSVEIFENDTFYREIEFTLTRELTREFRERTSYVVSPSSSSDAVLSGRIVDVARPTLVETENDLVSEQAVIVSARIVLTSRRTGRVLVDRIVRNRAEFVVERGETLETAFNEALRDLAEDIVNRLEDETFRRDLDKLRGSSEPQPR